MTLSQTYEIKAKTQPHKPTLSFRPTHIDKRIYALDCHRGVAYDVGKKGKTMLEKEKKALTRIAGVLSREPAVLRIVAYGSRVRGDFRDDSDFDVFVLVDKKTPALKNDIREVFYDYEIEDEIPFAVTILSREEYDVNAAMGSPYIKTMQEEGVVIYDAESGREKLSFEVPDREGKEDLGRRPPSVGTEEV